MLDRAVPKPCRPTASAATGDTRPANRPGSSPAIPATFSSDPASATAYGMAAASGSASAVMADPFTAAPNTPATIPAARRVSRASRRVSRTAGIRTRPAATVAAFAARRASASRPFVSSTVGISTRSASRPGPGTALAERPKTEVLGRTLIEMRPRSAPPGPGTAHPPGGGRWWSRTSNAPGKLARLRRARRRGAGDGRGLGRG